VEEAEGQPFATAQRLLRENGLLLGTPWVVPVSSSASWRRDCPTHRARQTRVTFAPAVNEREFVLHGFPAGPNFAFR
jgi:hypothetical protein